MTARTLALVWLFIGGAYGVLVGIGIIVLAVWPDVGFEAVQHLVFGDNSGVITPVARLATAVSGSLTSGLGATAMALPPALRPHAGKHHAARALLVGVLTWFVLDSAASVAVGAPMNVVGNVTYLLALAPPLAWLSRSSAS